METNSVSEEPLVLTHSHKRAVNSAKAHGLTNVHQLPGHKPPGHAVSSDIIDTKKVKKIRFAENLNIRFQITTGNEENIDFDQPLIDEEYKVMLQRPVAVYLMIGSLGVDTSRKEIFYETLWSSPMPSNDIVDFCSD